MTMLPWGDKMLVRPKNNQEQMSRGGIVLPETMKRDVHVGEVIATGPECAILQPGDVVMYTRIEPLNVDRPELQADPDTQAIGGMVILHESKVVAADGPDIRERYERAIAKGARMALIPRLLGTST